MPQTAAYMLLYLCCHFAILKQAFAFSGLNMMVTSPIFPGRASSLLQGCQRSTFLSDTTSNQLNPSSQIGMRASFWSNLFPDKSPPETPAATKSDDWKELKDPNSGKAYFWNQVTGSTTWQRPDSMPELANEKVTTRPLVAPNPKQFTFSSSPRTFVVGGCSAAGKSGGRLKENQDAIIIKAGRPSPSNPRCHSLSQRVSGREGRRCVSCM
jgi:hypothetical protein